MSPWSGLPGMSLKKIVELSKRGLRQVLGRPLFGSGWLACGCGAANLASPIA